MTMVVKQGFIAIFGNCKNETKTTTQHDLAKLYIEYFSAIQTNAKHLNAKQILSISLLSLFTSAHFVVEVNS